MEKFFKLLLIGLLLQWKLLLVNGWNTKKSNFDRASVINEMAMDMLKSCYMEFKTIIIHSDSDQTIINSIGKLETSTLMLISNSSKNNIGVAQYLHMPLFIMTPKSRMEFHDILMSFKSSPLWNIMAPFLILDKSSRKCMNAPNILKTAWEMNVVKSFFLCVNSKNVSMIYTYNPYTNRAPQPWKNVKTTKNRTDGWTMYSKLNGEGNICDGLNFDRTEHLDGSIIRAVVTISPEHEWIPDKDYDENLMEKMYPVDFLVIQAMKSALNVTFIFNVDEEGFDMKEKATGFYKRLENRSSDIAICLRTHYTSRHFQMTYPVFYSQLHIVTNNRGFYTPLEKIKNYYGIVTLISMCVIFSMTYIVIVLSGRRRRWAFAGFEVIRLIVNASIHSRMNTLSRRIFFTMIFLYCLIFQATFSGHLSAFLTKDEFRKNVEKLEDLKDPRYDVIYGSSSVLPLIDDPLLKKKFIVSHPNCAPLIIGNDSAACISDVAYLLTIVFDQKLHLSKEPISNTVYILPIRDDWLLRERLDIFLMRLEQGEHIYQLFKGHLEKERRRQNRILAMSEVNAHPIRLWMLDFIFYVLIGGLILAIVSFGCEWQIRRAGSLRRFRNVCVRRRVANRRN
ncbi:hypothetical protein PV328_000747 [Microctonus aethiopoides]|uniref:Ionotropic receptor n=1 Tax=Microctonus aethiopoides TaxID=144406 RepID=A0AA39FW93_9HYME|nr:hypothetical protein PV328_000747 [Microctonus aethiopoides]